MKLNFKFPFSNVFLVLEINDLSIKFDEINFMMTGLGTNEKWPVQFPWCQTLGVHQPLREGWFGIESSLFCE